MKVFCQDVHIKLNLKRYDHVLTDISASQEHSIAVKRLPNVVHAYHSSSGIIPCKYFCQLKVNMLCFSLFENICLKDMFSKKYYVLLAHLNCAPVN